MPAAWHIATPTTAAGAVGIIQLNGDIDEALARLGQKPLSVGRVSLRDLLGIDSGLVARWTSDCCQLMPHGGSAVMRRLAAALGERGLKERALEPRALHPEARSEVEAHALAAMARAASPLAIDLLLDQHRRWSEPGARSDAALDRILARLIEPPLVVAVGAPNVGKSSLVNELAGRNVSIVADEPGTTRDHVGVQLELAGLVVRYVDTPGIRSAPDPTEAEAQQLAVAVAAHANLLLRCTDATASPPALASLASVPSLLVGTRADLGPARVPVDVSVSVKAGQGVADLVTAIRERLVPESALRDHRPWRFW